MFSGWALAPTRPAPGEAASGPWHRAGPADCRGGGETGAASSARLTTLILGRSAAVAGCPDCAVSGVSRTVDG